MTLKNPVDVIEDTLVTLVNQLVQNYDYDPSRAYLEIIRFIANYEDETKIRGAG
jgi:hypothetical protein